MASNGQVAIVTGGTGAVGRAVVREFAIAGITVVVPYLDSATYDALQREMGDLAHDLHGYQVDVTDTSAVHAFIRQVLDERRRIDILVNLVGGYAGGRFVESGVDLWLEQFRLNFWSALLCTHAVLPPLIEQGRGRIVTIGSRLSLEPPTGSSAYAAAKAAVGSMTQSVAREIRTTGVTINCVAPSTIDTEANRRMMPRADRSRWVTPGQIAALIAYLCSDAASAVNGAIIPIYGQL